MKNDFFGGSINVTGLLTGQDILKNLKGRDLGDQVLLSTNMLRSGEDVFLDDMTVPQPVSYTHLISSTPTTCG